MQRTFERLRQWMWLPATVFVLLIGASEGGGGVTGTGSVAYGAISDFGSVFVNGVEYFTNTANIVIDGAPGQAESRLRVGMKVRVDGLLFGTGGTGQAATVAYDADVRGAIDAPVAITASGAFFTVDGIGVVATERTFVDGALGAGQLASGDRVEVSGLRDDSTGRFVALRISRLDVASGTVLTGAVSGVTPTTFALGGLTVAYDNTTLRDAPNGLADGMVVRVKSATDPANGVLAAAEVRAIDGTLRAAAGTEASAQGVVSGLTTSTFTLGGLVVAYDATTRYRNGTAADLANGAIVEAEGVVDAAGRLVAQRISFPAPDHAAAEAVVWSKTADGFMLLSPDGVQVVVGPDTKWRDKSSAKLSVFGLAQLNVGDRVAVSGLTGVDGIVAADGVTRIDPASGAMLQGRVSSASGGTITLLSVHVLAVGSTIYRDVDGSVLTSGAFFAKAVGRSVKATGTPSGSDMIASVLEIEP